MTLINSGTFCFEIPNDISLQFSENQYHLTESYRLANILPSISNLLIFHLLSPESYILLSYVLFLFSYIGIIIQSLSSYTVIVIALDLSLIWKPKRKKVEYLSENSSKTSNKMYKKSKVCMRSRFENQQHQGSVWNCLFFFLVQMMIMVVLMFLYQLS